MAAAAGAEAVLAVLQDCISLGSGEPNVPEHRSFVLYHNNSPRWSEVIKLPIPIDRFRGSHLRFEFRHCSSESHGRHMTELSEGREESLSLR